MNARLKGALGRRALGAVSDDGLVRELARRLNRSDGDGAELFAKLAERVSPKIASELADGLIATRPLDYERHRIELVIGSRAAAKRLRSVEKEPFTVDWIERSLTPGDVFYDIGANLGAYSLIAAKVTGNGARIFAFEPAPSSFHDLARNILHNGCSASIVPLPIALWSETGLLSFELRSELSGDSRHRVGPAGSDAPLAQTILGVRIDDLVEALGLPVPTHVKLDVDGYELDVLRGAERTLARPEWRSLIVELDPDETDRNRAITALLADAGLAHARRHARTASERYPHPGDRPDVYWTFTRE